MSFDTLHAQVMEGREFARRWRERRTAGEPLPELRMPLMRDVNTPTAAPPHFPYFDHRNCSQWESGE